LPPQNTQDATMKEPHNIPSDNQPPTVGSN
jgi:hypothetical protein